MNISPHHQRETLRGVLLVALIALLSWQAAALPSLKALGLSPLILGIVLGMIFANTLRRFLPQGWSAGLTFSSRTLLRIGIILYGLRISIQEIAAIGMPGLVASLIMVGSTFILGALLGQKILHLDRDTSLLVASGSAVCGAAAVLATEATLKSEPGKTAIAVSTVVLFGTLSLFLYPALQSAGLWGLDQKTYGLFTGASIHELAQVVGASMGAGPEAAKTAVVVKMTRILLLTPLLFILGTVLSFLDRKQGSHTAIHTKASFPWFVLGFGAMSGIHSAIPLPQALLEGINTLDSFLLTMAMTALGMDTGWHKFRQAGPKPFVLALFLYAWLVLGGLGVCKAISAV